MTLRNNTTEQIKVILLVSGRDFGRCRLASRLNRVLWPVMGKPALQRLIEQLAHQGVQRIVVCCENPAQEIKASLNLPAGLQIRFIEETFPRGPAGSIRDAIEPDRDKQVLVLPACTLMLPDIEKMAALHTQSRAEVTIFGLSGNGGALHGNQAQVYMCRASVLDHIPEKGYFDIKEGLIPALVKDGKVVYGAAPPSPVVSYTNWREYTSALRGLLINGSSFKPGEDYSNWNNNTDVWVGSNVQISPTAKIIGPAVIGNSSMISDNAVLFGPLIIGSNVNIGSGSVVDESVLWDRSVVGSKCRIRNSLIDYGRAIPNREVVAGRLVSAPETLIRKTKNAIHQRMIKAQITHRFPGKEMNEKSLVLSDAFQETWSRIIGPSLSILVIGALIFTYWNPVLKNLWRIWIRSDEYSSGLLVPVIAMYVLWLRRESFLKSPIHPNLWGLILLAAIQLFRYWSMYYMFDSGERLSFVLSIGALVFFLFGVRVFRYFIPIFLFLFLMLPLPKRVETFVMAPLQVWATVSSVFCLETLGYNVTREGNVVNINGTLVAVAEACNGLRMLMAFIVVSGTAALIVSRKKWEKIIILVSSIPIALLCNTIRLTLTSYAFTKLDSQSWEKVFHDFGGLAMMPLALGFIFLELWLLSKVVIEPKNTQELIIMSKRKP